ncbi:hypothetical protein SDC9_123472 [bioreactor metagenome]|uniref:Uncharacterized protein n=1 Tax=bioreactor metagenome TaxID=1076179 RepID=A0A645CHW7_9ZZZZ
MKHQYISQPCGEDAAEHRNHHKADDCPVLSANGVKRPALHPHGAVSGGNVGLRPL